METNETGLQIITPNGVIKTVIGENAKAVADILMGNITRVQNDPAFVPQAKEIRESSRELINLMKVEVEMFKEVAKYQASQK